MARVPKPRVELLALTNEATSKPHILWQATRCLVGDNPPPEADVETISDNDALCVAGMIRSELIENTPGAANYSRLLAALDIPPNFETLTQSGKTNALARFGAPSHIPTEFMDNRDKLTVIRSVKGPSGPWPLAFLHTSGFVIWPTTGHSAPRRELFASGSIPSIMEKHSPSKSTTSARTPSF